VILAYITGVQLRQLSGHRMEGFRAIQTSTNSQAITYSTLENTHIPKNRMGYPVFWTALSNFQEDLSAIAS